MNWIRSCANDQVLCYFVKILPNLSTQYQPGLILFKLKTQKLFWKMLQKSTKKVGKYFLKGLTKLFENYKRVIIARAQEPLREIALLL